MEAHATDTRLHNAGMMAAGITLVGVGDFGVVIGAVLLAEADSSDPFTRGAGIATMVASIAHLGIGVPLLAIGAQTVPLEAPLPPRRLKNPGMMAAGIVMVCAAFVALPVGIGLIVVNVQSSGARDTFIPGIVSAVSVFPHVAMGIPLIVRGSRGVSVVPSPDARLQIRATPGGGTLTLSF